MSTTRTDLDPSSDEAALWAARLDGGEMTDSQRDELDAWLASDPRRRAVLARFCQLSVDLDQTLPELLAEGRVKIPRQTPQPRLAWPRRWALIGLAAAAAAVGFAVWTGANHAKDERIAAEVGKRRSFTLADGTKVELNANTSLLVEAGSSERRVRLADGEAFFEVTKDKAHPFVVQTPAGSVRVVGTKFNVLTEASSRLDVTVVEGQVQVRVGDASGEPVTLEHGDRLSLADGGVSVTGLSPAALEDSLAWRDGWIVCDGTPLSEILPRAAHYFGRSITATKGAASVRIGARLKLDDLDQFLKDLQETEKTLQVTHDPAGGARVSLRGEN